MLTTARTVCQPPAAPGLTDCMVEQLCDTARVHRARHRRATRRANSPIRPQPTVPPVACYTALLAVALMHPPAAAAVQGRGRTDVRPRALDRAFVDQRALDDGPLAEREGDRMPRVKPAGGIDRESLLDAQRAPNPDPAGVCRETWTSANPGVIGKSGSTQEKDHNHGCPSWACEGSSSPFCRGPSSPYAATAADTGSQHMAAGTGSHHSTNRPRGKKGSLSSLRDEQAMSDDASRYAKYAAVYGLVGGDLPTTEELTFGQWTASPRHVRTGFRESVCV